MNQTTSFLIIKHQGKAKNPLNRIFGPPSFLAEDEWPRSGNQFEHHILSMDLSAFPNFLGNNQKYLSVFLPIGNVTPEEGLLTVITKEEVDANKVVMSNYPKDYVPWWEKGWSQEESHKKGLSFDLEPDVSLLDEEQIRKINNGEVKPDELTNNKEILDHEFDFSYIGGIPIWFQVDETPTSVNGLLQFVLSISGFEECFTNTPLEDFIFYLFTDRNGHFDWIVQR